MWDIYSIGDGSFLASILNAIAMLTGTGDFAVIVRTGFGLGVLLMAVNGVLQGGKGVPWQQAVVALVLYLVMFGPQARVNVEDVYTSQIYPVDNVPFGVAAAGSIMSTVGYSMTSLFETAFATPSMSSQSYGASLKHLQAAREAMLNRINIGQANSPSGQADMEKSWHNYVTECTLTAIDVHANNPGAGKSLDAVLNGPLPNSLKFESNGFYYTKIYLPGGPQTLPCETAFDLLNDYTGAEFLPAAKRNIKSYIAPDSIKTTDQMLQDALDGIEQYGIGVDTYLKAVYLTPIYHNGVISKHLDNKKQTMAAIVNEAVQQRNVQWQAQKSVFETIVQPLITFMEGFFYALTPFMGLAIGLGVMGMKMLGKYLVMALWIQLWMPIMAIVNHYMHAATAGKIAALQQNITSSPMSLAGLQQWDGIIQNQLAVGGMLASSVPVLSLFVISGSYYALTNIASQMTGRDHIDESKAAPSTSDPAKFESMMGYNPETGLTRTGADGALSKFSWSNSDAQTTSSASEEARTASSQFSSMLGQKVSALSSHSNSGSYSTRFGSSTSVGNSESEQMLKSRSQGLMDKWSDTQGVKEQTIATLGGQAALGSKRGGTSASLKAGIQKATSLTDAQASELAGDLKTSFGEGTSWSAKYQDQVAREISYGGENLYTRGTNLSNDKQLQQSAQESVQATEKYQEAMSSGVTGKMDQSVEGTLAGKKLSENGQAFNQLSQSIQDAGLNGAVDRWMDSSSGQETIKRMGGNERAAEGYAMLLTANGQNDFQERNLSSLERGTLADSANSALASTFGQQGGPSIGGGATRNAGIADGQTPGSGDVQGQVQSQLGGIYTPDASGLERRVQSGISTFQGGSYGPTDNEMSSQFADRKNLAHSQSDDAGQQLAGKVKDELRGQMEKSNDETMMTSMTSQAGNTLATSGSNVWRAAAAGGDMLSGNFDYMDNWQARYNADYQEQYVYAQDNGLTEGQSALYAETAMASGVEHRVAGGVEAPTDMDPTIAAQVQSAAHKGPDNNDLQLDNIRRYNNSGGTFASETDGGNNDGHSSDQLSPILVEATTIGPGK